MTENEQREAAARFVSAGYAFLNSIANLEVCEGRTCIRCHIADVVMEAEQRWQIGRSVEPSAKRTGFIPWITGVLFKFGFTDLSWRIADWYMDRSSAKASQGN